MSAVRVICGDTPIISKLIFLQTNVTEPQMRGLFLNVLTRWQRRHVAKFGFHDFSN